MTASKDKKQIPKKNIFNFGEEDLVLTEMHTQHDDSEFTIASLELSHYQEDKLDSVDMDEHFVVPDNQVSNHQVDVPHSIEVKNPAEQSDNSDLKITKFEQAQQVQLAKNITTNFSIDYFNNASSEKNLDEKSSADRTIEVQVNTTYFNENSAGETINAETVNPETEFFETTQDDQQSERTTSIIDGSGMTVAVLSQFKSKQENLNKQYKKLIQASANNVKKATIITYVALFFAGAAFLSTIILGFLLSRAHSDISTLIESVATLKDDIESINLKISAASVNNKLSNEKTESYQELSKETPLKNQAQALAENEQIKEDLAIPENTNSSDTSRTSVPALENKPEAKLAAKPELSTIPEITDKSSTKTQAEDLKNKHIAEPVAIIKQADTSTVAISTIAKTSARQELPENKTEKKSPPLSLPVNHSKTPAITKDKTVESKSGINKTTTDKLTAEKIKAKSEIWFVKIESLKEQQTAKSKAAILTKKGIPVKLAKITDKKHQIWYRLQIGGFKTREDANHYAEKLRKTHKLDSVSVTQ